MRQFTPSPGSGSLTDQSAISICPGCQREGSGRFCSLCGEEKLRQQDYSLRRFLGEIVSIVTNLESNVLRSFGKLILKPGLLTAEYFSGSRKRYLKPIQLFLFCNIIFFFVQSYTRNDTFTTPLRIQMYDLPYSALVRGEVEQKLAKKRISLEEYREQFDRATAIQAKSLVFVMIPILALLMLILYWRQRRYFVEHLVFSTHLYAYFLLLLPALGSFLFAFVTLAFRGGMDLRSFFSDAVFSTLFLLALAIYLFVALRRFYGQSRVMTGLKCLVLSVGIVIVLFLYRFTLFFTTFYSV